MDLVQHLECGKRTHKRTRVASPVRKPDADSSPKNTSSKESENAAASNDMDGADLFVSDLTSGDVAVGECDAVPLMVNKNSEKVVVDDFSLEHSRMWKECQDLADCALLPGDRVPPFDCIGGGCESLMPSFVAEHVNQAERAPATIDRKDSCSNSRLMQLTEEELKLAEILLAEDDDNTSDDGNERIANASQARGTTTNTVITAADANRMAAAEKTALHMKNTNKATNHSDNSDIKISPSAAFKDGIPMNNDDPAGSRKRRKFGNGLASTIREKSLIETSHKERRQKEDRVPSVGNSLCAINDAGGLGTRHCGCADRFCANSGNDSLVDDAYNLSTSKIIGIDEERKSAFMTRSCGDEIKSQSDGDLACDSKADLSNLAKSLKHSADAMRDSAGRQRPLSLYFYLCACIKFLLLANSKSPEGDVVDPQRSSSELSIMQQTLVLLEYCLKTSKYVASVNQTRAQTHRILCRGAAIAVCETLFLTLIAVTKLKLSFIRRRKLRSEFVRVQLMQEDSADDDQDVTKNSYEKLRSMNASTRDIVDETLPPIEAMSRSAASAKLTKAKIANVKGKEAYTLMDLLKVSLEMGNWFQMDEALEGACDKLEHLQKLLDGKD